MNSNTFATILVQERILQSVLSPEIGHCASLSYAHKLISLEKFSRPITVLAARTGNLLNNQVSYSIISHVSLVHTA